METTPPDSPGIACQLLSDQLRSKYTHVIFILHNLVIVKVYAHNEGSHERRIGADCVSPRDPFSGDRDFLVTISVFGRHRLGERVSSQACNDSRT